MCTIHLGLLVATGTLGDRILGSCGCNLMERVRCTFLRGRRSTGDYFIRLRKRLCCCESRVGTGYGLIGRS
jgi:hypothetical protein